MVKVKDLNYDELFKKLELKYYKLKYEEEKIYDILCKLDKIINISKKELAKEGYDIEDKGDSDELESENSYEESEDSDESNNERNEDDLEESIEESSDSDEDIYDNHNRTSDISSESEDIEKDSESETEEKVKYIQAVVIKRDNEFPSQIKYAISLLMFIYIIRLSFIIYAIGSGKLRYIYSA